MPAVSFRSLALHLNPSLFVCFLSFLLLMFTLGIMGVSGGSTSKECVCNAGSVTGLG